MNAKMITSAVVAGVVFCAVPVTADVTWSVDENGTGSAAGEGTLVLDESQSLSGLNVTSDALTLSGEGIVFTNAAPAVSIFGNAVLDLTLASTGSISFVHSPGYDARTYADSFLSENYITVFNDMDLSEYYPLVALGAGGSMIDGIPLKPFHLVRSEGTLICQFHVVDDYWAKCVKVEFVQSGNDVQAKIVYVAYNDSSYYGSDFDSGSIPFVIAASSNSEGYNLKSITLVKGLDDAFLHINRKIDAASIVFGDSLTVTADPGNVIAGSGTVPPDMEINGTLVITNVQNMVFTNAISGNGSLYLGGLVKTIQPDKAEVVHDALMPAAWTNVVYDSIVTAITNVYINAFSGLAIPNKPGWIYHLKNDGMNVIGQCQVEDGSWIKCVYLEFMQQSTNVMARIVNACYCSKSNGLGVDFDTLEWGQAAWGNAVRQSYNTGSNPNDYVYGIGSFTMYFDVDTQQDASPAVTMSFSGENTMVGARIHQRGGLVEILSKNALPTGGGIYTVSDNGILQLKASGCSVHDGIASGKTLLCAIRGGVIRQNAEYVLDGDSQKIYLDNGILELLNKGGQGADSFNDSYTYVNHITLANGSRVIGKRARVSYCVNDAIWRVTGTSPSVIESGLALASTTGQRVTFDVEDVTGNGEPDLTVANTIVTYDTSHHTNVVFIKAGDGTMCLEARVRLYTPMRLDAGTLLLDDSGILKGNFPAVSITFNGGTLAAAAGTSNAVGTVSVTKDSTIVVGEGAVFTFPDCSAEEWTSDKTLTISGEVDKTSVRFGTDSSALTAQQQKALRINGERAMLNAEGYVRLGISGLRFFVK